MISYYLIKHLKKFILMHYPYLYLYIIQSNYMNYCYILVISFVKKKCSS